MFPQKENNQKQRPWNKGRLVGQKPPLKLKEIWEIRIRLQIDKKHRDLALFNLAIDSKLRACDLLKLRVSNVSQGNRIASRAAVVQQKTSQSVQFEITEQARQAYRPGSNMRISTCRTSCSRVAYTSLRTYRRGSTRVSSSLGLILLDSILPCTERIRCEGRKHHWYTGGLRTFGPCNFCWATPSLKAPYGI
jgi:hypothetical protein